MEKNIEMKRKVLFKKFIPIAISCVFGEPSKRIEGTGRMEEEFNNTGIFHKFGMAMKEDDSGFKNYTIAIIEDESGNLHEVLPSNMKFIKSEEHIGIEYSKEAVENWVQKLMEDRNANLESYQLSGLVRYILNKL